MSGKQITKGMDYSVVGRYMSGPEVSGYHLVGTDGSQIKVSKEQLIFMVGKGVILNCRVQMYNGKPLLRGKNINLNELPVYDEAKGQYKRIDNEVPIKRRGTTVSPMGQLQIVGRIMHGTKCMGYILLDGGNVERKLSRQKVLELAEKNMLRNATIQQYQGKPLLRGVGIDLSTLPSIPVESLEKK